ncbi:MAG: FAD binding domain-containing protein [Deltaproteobacteria bacterium]|nr:FAD binding domain-containing protein [Deltaproteobacteria bacterium]
MMPLRRFAIHRPADLTEAAEMLEHYGDTGTPYAGGTELLLAMRHDLLRYEHLIDIKAVAGLDGIERRDGHLHIGAGATHRMIERSAMVRELLPVMAEMAANVANVRVRASGTLGGNLAFAEPHSDPATLLLALGGTARAQGKSGERTLAMDELLAGAYENSLARDEVLTGVDVPLPGPSQRCAYLKFQVHERPLLGLALLLDLSEDGREIRAASCAVGCVSPTPCRSSAAETLIAGPADAAGERLQQAADTLADEAALTDDREGSAEYKRHLIGVLLRRAARKCLDGDG